MGNEIVYPMIKCKIFLGPLDPLQTLWSQIAPPFIQNGLYCNEV